MTKEEFEKRFLGSIYDFVVGYDCDMQRTINNKTRNDYHTALTQKEFDEVMELFKKHAEEN